MTVPPRRIIEVTGEEGIEVWGETPEALFCEAALGLRDLCVHAPALTPNTAHSVHLQADSLEGLLVAWLNELLFLFEIEGMIFASARFKTLDSKQLQAEVSGETLNPTRHRVRGGVKAATYHGVECVREGDLWRARVIFDI